ncbi:hypothetical protein BJY04DRAFT_176329 [Aspergillus karnatakaensis]|uniref:Zn(II)2Cys6 transcription factor domain-containing protein n=1 Tax=Aspergillus karnatakaensis TaxID=1810916 RepID=UPI003CCD1D4E
MDTPGTHTFTASDSESATLTINALKIIQASASDADRESDASVKKRKRVRTGCFTCRDRHLKCDEALGRCQNCKKSDRICRRGVRLNFVDTQVSAPPTYIAPAAGGSVTFRDDSRTIASEYVGGFETYPPPQQDHPLESPALQTSTPVQPGLNPLFRNTKHGASRHVYLENPAELSLLSAFVSQIAPWMDIADESKHFSRILPFYTPEEPLLHATFAACAGCHVTQRSNQANERIHRHSIANQMLSDSLQDADHDLALCAAAAVVLEVAEMLISGPMQSAERNTSASARSLIRQCQWNTRTPGLGAACSWLSILKELLDCLIAQRTLVWYPDTWGVDMSFAAQPLLTGSEELWTQRIIWICAKVSDFRLSSSGRGASKSTRGAESHRLQEWELYNDWCDRWITTVPRSMLPLGQVQPWQTNPPSVFPQVWLLERSASVAQILYHISRIMLIEADPLRQSVSAERQSEQQHHAYNVCGIVSNDRDAGIPIFSAYFLAIVSDYLIDRKAQEEVFTLLDHFNGTSGMNIDRVRGQLQQKWNWNSYAGHEPAQNTTNPTESLDFSASNPNHEFLQTGLDPFTHLADSESYMDQHAFGQH